MHVAHSTAVLNAFLRECAVFNRCDEILSQKISIVALEKCELSK